eukprot:TRINITY_DN27283_c0_g1_i2.p1 TRINITY_DN27283_c0_g1~~TRINITY_DN27283_c0_g1_i2.p1  ORF type:complete len:147 (-),score=9.41 TRINITY_DN27283_c0_g1_i2:275-658(-)
MVEGDDATIASRYLINRDLRSAWYFVRCLGVRCGQELLPTPACNLVVRCLGRDMHGRSPGEVAVSSTFLSMIQDPEGTPACRTDQSEETDSTSSSTMPSAPDGARSTSSGSDRTRTTSSSHPVEENA